MWKARSGVEEWEGEEGRIIWLCWCVGWAYGTENALCERSFLERAPSENVRFKDYGKLEGLKLGFLEDCGVKAKARERGSRVGGMKMGEGRQNNMANAWGKDRWEKREGKSELLHNEARQMYMDGCELES